MTKIEAEGKYFEFLKELFDRAKKEIAEETVTPSGMFIIDSAIKEGEFICGLNCRYDAGSYFELPR